MTREKSCFVFAIFDAVVIVSLCHFNSWMEAWRCGFKFLKSKPLARIGQQNRPLNMALKALLRTCVGFQVKSVNGNLNGTAKWNICTRKWSTGAQMVER